MNQSMKTFYQSVMFNQSKIKRNDFVQNNNNKCINSFKCFVVICFKTRFFFIISGTPINRLPIMAKQVLDLYELYNLVLARGGLVEVINKKQWQEVIKGLGLPSSITSAAFTLRTQ